MGGETRSTPDCLSCGVPAVATYVGWRCPKCDDLWPHLNPHRSPDCATRIWSGLAACDCTPKETNDG